MPSKNFVIGDSIPVTVYKRRSSRSVRLTISQDGRQARVSIPLWAPYSLGIEFARSKETWVKTHLKPTEPLVHGQAVGKAHHLEFKVNPSLTGPVARVQGSAVVISHPDSVGSDDETVQNAAEKACIRALRTQAESLLPQRLALLADKHGFGYKSVSVKRLKSRWGSCDQEKKIVLNIFLMQLPWELIDYVLMHELTHTRVLKHGPDFWSAMEEKMPQAKSMKKKLRGYQPVLAIES